MDTHETIAKYNIAETCVASVSPKDLQALSEDPSKEIFDPSLKLTYGPICGSDDLRSNLSRLYSAKATFPLLPTDILVTPGAIAANLNVFYALIRGGDHVICHYPTYQQLYEVPAALGAEVSLWRAKEEDEWQLDIEELKGLIRPETKMIIIKCVRSLQYRNEFQSYQHVTKWSFCHLLKIRFPLTRPALPPPKALHQSTKIKIIVASSYVIT